jgi:hypothetical protein
MNYHANPCATDCMPRQSLLLTCLDEETAATHANHTQIEQHLDNLLVRRCTLVLLFAWWRQICLIIQIATNFTVMTLLAAFNRGTITAKGGTIEIGGTSQSFAEVETELKLRNEAKCESEMTLLTSKLSCDDRRSVIRSQETGQWLSLLPSTENGNERSAQEFHDAPLLRHARGSPATPATSL